MEVEEVCWGEAMEGLKGVEEDSVGNAGLYCEPAEVDESGADVLPGLRAGENAVFK